MILSAPDPALDRSFAEALLRLQHEAYRTQAALIGTDQLDALGADDDSLPAWRGNYLVAWEGTRLLGAVAWRSLADAAEIDRLMVDPEVHRRGVASALLAAVLAALATRPVVTVTGRDNSPGLALYRRFDFHRTSDAQTTSGLWVTHLRREPRAHA